MPRPFLTIIKTEVIREEHKETTTQMSVDRDKTVNKKLCKNNALHDESLNHKTEILKLLKNLENNKPYLLVLPFTHYLQTVFQIAEGFWSHFY